MQETKATENIKDKLKYTCLDCNYKTKTKSHMDEHVRSLHGNGPNKEITFICATCKHEFSEEENYNKHVKIHDEQNNANLLTSSKKIDVMVVDLLDDNEDDNEAPSKPTLEEEIINPPPVVVESEESKSSKISVKISIEEPPKESLVTKVQESVSCPFCQLKSKDLAALKTHIEKIHNNTVEENTTYDESLFKAVIFALNVIIVKSLAVHQS